MHQLLHLGQAVAAHAKVMPGKIAARDSARSFSYRELDNRANRLASALLGLGLDKGDRVAVLAYNRVEWIEIYVATARAGLVIVPINFRLTGAELQYIAEDAGARAMIVQDELLGTLESVRPLLSIPSTNYIHFGGCATADGFLGYEMALDRASSDDSVVDVRSEDPWALFYTSGTTGKPKGALRDHTSVVLLGLVTALDEGFSRDDTGLLVMPLCHSNSFWYAVLLTYIGATTIIHDRQSFDPEYLLRVLTNEQVTFTSLVPTHYIMMNSLPVDVRRRYPANAVSRLKISSAPARMETKLAILEQFPGSQLLEGYGSTECGWVTLLRPHEQMEKLGSIGRELTGSAKVMLLDDEGNEVCEGEVGELFSRTPYTFGGYWNLPEKTSAAFRGSYCSVGDMARRDADGYYYLVDRKSNMIISGGENIYPSELETALGAHPKIQDLAVIGLRDELWGESVCAVVILRQGEHATGDEIIDWCRGRLAGFKRPRTVVFINETDMPRTSTGKIQHRLLRERYQPTR